MTLGALAAARWSGLSGGQLGGLLAFGAAMLAAGATAASPFGFVGVAACFGVLQFGIVLSNARLQHVISGPARATVLSVAGVGAEVGAVAVYGAYALGSLWFATPALVAGFALPLLLVAALTAASSGAAASPRAAASSGKMPSEEIH